jgi:GINS complex subunit 2
MAQPWLPEELNFIASEALVHISPHFTAPKTAFMAQPYGPFQAGRPTKVPLWLALFLNSSQSCTLIPPKWLTLASVRALLERDRREQGTLAPVRPHYMELSHAFFTRAPTSIRDVDHVRTAVDELWLMRSDKIRRSIAEATSETLDFFELPNATRMELHLYREPITRIRDILTSLNAIGAQGADADE